MTHDALQILLEDSQRAGIYHLPASDRRAVMAAAESAGLACFEVSFADTGEIGSVLAKLGRALEFPDWYGNNFDALHDCLTDFSWREAAGYVLLISRTDKLQAQQAASFALLNEVLANAVSEWRARGLPMWVFYDSPAAAPAGLPTLA